MNDDSHLVGGGDGQTPLHANDLPGLRHRIVRTKSHLDELERLNVALGRRWAFARSRDPETILEDAFLRTLHGRMFGDVWEWAGKYRTVDVSIGMDWYAIPTSTRSAIDDAGTQLAVASTGDARRRVVASLHQRLTEIHPFPNGNGRVSRLYVELVARAYGMSVPVWGTGIADPRGTYLKALRQADLGELSPLVKFMWSAG